MTVYVLTHGPLHEGGEVVGVFSSQKGAEERIEAILTEWKYQIEWEISQDYPSSGTIKNPEPGIWLFGTDYVSLDAWEVLL